MEHPRGLTVIDTCTVGAGAEQHPFQHTSDDCLALLLRMSFSMAQVAELLGSPIDDTTQHMRLGPQYTQLVHRIKVDRDTAQRVDARCGVLFQQSVECQNQCSLFDLAHAWSRMREHLDGPSAAALLWMVARARPHCYRKLEAAIVEDLSHTAFRNLSLGRDTAPSCSASFSTGDAC